MYTAIALPSRLHSVTTHTRGNQFSYVEQLSIRKRVDKITNWKRNLFTQLSINVSFFHAYLSIMIIDYEAAHDSHKSKCDSIFMGIVN